MMSERARRLALGTALAAGIVALGDGTVRAQSAAMPGAGSWLEVACEVPGGTAIPIGTTVTVTAGGRTQRRDIASGDSYLNSHDPRLHFGLGEAAAADTIDVRWPDGSHTVRRNEAARRLVVVRKEP